ncbi:MAG: DUF4783 domain-containing protein [Paludibacteraceae bacterium]
MRPLKIILLCFFTLNFGYHSPAQTFSGIPDGIIAAITQGDANRLSLYLGTNVELVISNKNDVYSKQQAVKIIADFFRENSVKNFQILHSSAKDASGFAIGRLETSKGSYRAYILTRKNKDKLLIQQLRVEQSNE